MLYINLIICYMLGQQKWITLSLLIILVVVTNARFICKTDSNPVLDYVSLHVQTAQETYCMWPHYTSITAPLRLVSHELHGLAEEYHSLLLYNLARDRKMACHLKLWFAVSGTQLSLKFTVKHDLLGEGPKITWFSEWWSRIIFLTLRMFLFLQLECESNSLLL